MAEPAIAAPHVRRIGRYALHEEIASGGMATVYLGRLVGQTGFSRPVAIKRLHDNLATDPKFVSMLLDEARLAARVRHPHVVATLDVVEEEREVVVVMEYVHGESLAALRKLASERGQTIPPKIAATIVAGALHGLHAAHEAVDEQGEPLHIVHRDVSPQNILVGVDGVARVLDFGIAKAAGRMQTTQDGKIKGKFGYMAPEQLKGDEVTAQADVYAAAVVLWETLTGRRLYPEDADAATILTHILFHEIEPPSRFVSGLPPDADAVIVRGLAKNPEQRFATALEMATAIEAAFGVASPAEISAYVKDTAKEAIGRKAESLAVVERADTDAGQKQRREVVARVARHSEPPPSRSQARSRWALFVVGVVALAFVGGFVSVRALRARDARPRADTNVEPSVAPLTNATGVTTAAPRSSAALDVLDAGVSAPSTASASSASSEASEASVRAPVLSGAGRRKPLGGSHRAPRGAESVNAAGAEGSGAPETTPPNATAPASNANANATDDAGGDLIPKFRK